MRTRTDVALWLLLVLFVGATCVGFYSRAAYGLWSPLAAPERFHFCGARYYRSGDARTTSDKPEYTVSRAQAQKIDGSTQWLHAATVGPRRWQVYRTSTWECPELEEDLAGHHLYVKTGPDQYMPMTDAH